MKEVGEGVYRLGSNWANFYLVEDGGALTVIDTGFPGYAGQLDGALLQLGRGPKDVKAIVLTHTHADHIGGAPAIVRATGAPIFVHRGESGRATGAEKARRPKGFYPSLIKPRMWSLIGHAIKNKGAGTITVPEVTGFEDDAILDVPGKPRVVFSPGHSIAHCALLLEDRRVFFCGDAMGTLAVDSGKTGPQVHPFNEDRDQAVRSLDVLEKVPAELLLPGHGEPWAGPMADAVALARN